MLKREEIIQERMFKKGLKRCIYRYMGDVFRRDMGKLYYFVLMKMLEINVELIDYVNILFLILSL